MTEQLKAATVRALYGSILTAALTFLTTYQMTAFDEPRRLEVAAVAAGVAFFGYMLARGAAEGIIDSGRQESGNVQPSDVGQPQPR